MERTTGALQLLLTTKEVDGVVAVAAVGGAATREHEPTLTQLPQVVRHQALRLVNELRQLPHGPIALDQGVQQAPPQWMRDKLHEPRGINNGVA
jgi:hypothetical protein